MTTSTRDVIRSALGLFVGVTVPLVGYFVYSAQTVTDSGLSHIASEQEQGPGKVVAGAMPQVAIMGHRDGPGGTREVLIQVPGIPGPQSVFVLPDGETMIAGRLVDSSVSAYGIVPDTLIAELESNDQSNSGVVKRIKEATNDEPRLDSTKKTSESQTPLLAKPELPAPASTKERIDGVPVPAVSTPAQVAVPNADVIDTPVVAAQPAESTQNDLAPTDIKKGSDVEPVAVESSAPLVTATLPNEGDLTTRHDFQEEMQRIVAESEVFINIKAQTSNEDQQEAYYKAVQSLTAVSQGDGEKDLYVFFDPNCPVCHNLYKELVADVVAGNIVVHWVPSVVFTNRPSSIISSAKLIEGVERGDANMERELARIMTRSGYTDEWTAGYEETNNESLSSVAFNAALMSIARPEAPLLVFRGPDGALNIEAGIPAPGLINRIKDRE